MMKLKRCLKRIAAFSLAVLMTVVAYPYDSVVYAGPDDYPPEILFPIEVYDFPQDELLFQWLYQDLDLFTNPADWKNPEDDSTKGQGLIEPELKNGLPVYKKATIERIAKYVQTTLQNNNAGGQVLNNIYVDGKVNYLSLRNYIKNGQWTAINAVDGILTNGAVIDNNYNLVRWVGAANDGTVTFEYNCQQAGMRTIRLYYASGGARSFQVVTNEGTVNPQEQVVQCPATGNYNEIGAVPVTVRLNMVEGINTISVSGDNGAESPELGRIEIDNSYSFEAVGGMNFDFDWEDSGMYYLTVESADDNAVYNCTVNGVNVDVGVSEQNSIPVNLARGNNTIQLSGAVERIKIYSDGYPIGVYDESVEKFGNAEKGWTNKGWTDITTCMDYGYFMTSNLFRSNASVNTVADAYDYLVFHKVEDKNEAGDAAGKTAYEFMADLNHENVDLIYNQNEKTVRNVALLEAEDGTLAGGAVVNNNAVNNIGGGNNGSVTFTYESTLEGEHSLSLFYASALNRTFDVTVINANTDEDGDTVTTNQLNNGSWENATDEPEVVQVNLVKGKNTIIISGTNGNWAPNLDYIEILGNIEGDEIRPGGSLFLADEVEKTNPIDRNFEGEDDQEHNFHYTVKSSSNFVYKEGAGQYFYFSGDDDVYVFVNGKLLVDLGGAHQQIDDDFNLDELAQIDEDGDGENDYGLEDGKVVSLDFFYMERHTTASNFYAKLNFKLASDELRHIFEYQVIPYGHLANLTYSFTAMRELHYNKNFTFKDNFGNVFGAEGLVLAEGVSLLNNTLVVTVKDIDGNPIPDMCRTYTFDNPHDPTQADLDKIAEMMKFFREDLVINQNETLEISGAQYDTSIVPYESYEETDTESERLVTFTPSVTYDAWMFDATVPTTNTLTASNPVKVIVGNILITTAGDEDHNENGVADGIEDENGDNTADVNEKKELADYGAFTFTRVDTRNVATVCYENTATYDGATQVNLTKRSLGYYTLTVDETILTGYTVIIKAIVKTKDADGNDVIQTYTSLNPDGTNMREMSIDYDAVYNGTTWSYPEVIFELKAIRDVPDLKDLT